jgi:hypothetical protein
MGIDVLIEPIAEGRYRAQTGSPLSLTVEAETRAGAKQQIANMIQDRICNGIEIDSVEVGLGANHPLAKYAGDLKGSPLFELWQQAIKDFRSQLDPDADR